MFLQFTSMRGLAFLIALLFSSAALATPCTGPTITAGFGDTFSGTTVVTGFLYDSNIRNMYVTFPGSQYYTYLNVPYSTATGFANTRTPDQYYSSRISSSYRVALSTETCQAILTEAGAYITIT